MNASSAMSIDQNSTPMSQVLRFARPFPGSHSLPFPALPSLPSICPLIARSTDALREDHDVEDGAVLVEFREPLKCCASQTQFAVRWFYSEPEVV